MPELSFLCISLHFNLYSHGLSPCCVWILAVWLRIIHSFFCKTVAFSALAEHHSVIEWLLNFFVLPSYFSAYPKDTFILCYSNLPMWQNYICPQGIFLWCYSLQILFVQYVVVRGDISWIFVLKKDRLEISLWCGQPICPNYSICPNIQYLRHQILYICRVFSAEFLVDWLRQAILFVTAILSSSAQALQPLLQMHWGTLHQKLEPFQKVFHLVKLVFWVSKSTGWANGETGGWHLSHDQTILGVKYEHHTKLSIKSNLRMVLEVDLNSSWFSVSFTEDREVRAAALQAKWCRDHGCSRASSVLLLGAAGGKRVPSGVQQKALIWSGRKLMRSCILLHLPTSSCYFLE